jgi:transglutaminase-like putative cysteine protease
MKLKCIYLFFFILFISYKASAQSFLKVDDKTKNFEKLTADLCKNTTGEKEKAEAIYNWITRNIKYDYKAIKNNSTKTYTCNQILKRKKGICKDYTTLFVAMCREANLQAEEVVGYTKNWQFDNDDELFEPNHAWAVVRINNEWQLVDATKGAGYLGGRYRFPKNVMKKVFPKKSFYTKNKKFVFSYDPNYFAQDPETFRLESIPADPIWQLTDIAMPIKVFSKGTNAVREFNETVSKSVHKSKAIDNFLRENEYKQTVSCANRTIAHNPNFKTKMIEKYFLDLDVYMDNMNANPKAYKDSALQALRKSEKILNEQKADYTYLYNRLKQRNTEKKQITLAYKQELQMPSRQYVSKATRNMDACDNTIGKEKDKKDMLVSNVLISSFRDISVNKNVSVTNDATLDASVNGFNVKNIALDKALKQDASEMVQLRNKNTMLFDTMMRAFNNVAMALNGEMKSRNEMHDVFDDEVLNYISDVKKYKLQSLDKMQVEYNANFDSIIAIGNRINVNRTAMLTNLKQKAKLVEQQKKNGKNVDVDYANTYGAFTQTKEDAKFDHDESIKYLIESKAQNKQIRKINEQLVEAFYYIKKTEKFRTKLHKDNIKDAEKYDKVINKANITLVKKYMKDFQKVK